MYEIIKYVKDHGMNVSISYKYVEDIIKLEVSKSSGVSLYKIDDIVYGIELIKFSPEDLLFRRVEQMVYMLEKRFEEVKDEGK